MKKILLILLVIAFSITVYSQSNQKILNFYKNGSLIDQKAANSIDSITFSKMPLMVLSSPANGDTGISLPPSLVWNSFPGATSYTLQISTDSLFGSFFFNSSGLNTISQAIIGLLSSTKYFWRVQANSTYNSQWSQVWKFTTLYLEPTACGQNLDYAGKTYHTVTIGTQCWLQENLDVGKRIDGSLNQTKNDTLEKYCYNDDPANCTNYGGLYQWNEAMQYGTTPGSQGICPIGWHIPTYAEYQSLVTTVNNDGNALKMVGQGTGSGAGTNTSGFSALLAGFRSDDGAFYYLGNSNYFWSSTENNVAYILSLYGNVSNLDFGFSDKVLGYVVRCLKY